MSGPAFIVQVKVPQRSARQDVQVHPPASIQETRLRQTDHRPQCRREVQLAFVAELTQHEGPCDVGRPFLILAAAVHQQHPFCLQLHIAFRHSDIMHQGRMFLVRRSSLDRFDEMLLFLPESQQLIARRDLSDLLFAHMCLQPIHEAGHRHRVADMAAPDVFQLHRILLCLHQHDRIRSVDDGHILRQGSRDAIVRVRFVQQYFAGCGDMLHLFIDRVIRCRAHADLRKGRLQIIAQPRVIDIKHGILLIDEDIT